MIESLIASFGMKLRGTSAPPLDGAMRVGYCGKQPLTLSASWCQVLRVRVLISIVSQLTVSAATVCSKPEAEWVA